MSTCIVLKFQASQEEWREKREEKEDIYAVRIVLLHTGTQWSGAVEGLILPVVDGHFTRGQSWGTEGERRWSHFCCQPIPQGRLTCQGCTACPATWGMLYISDRLLLLLEYCPPYRINVLQHKNRYHVHVNAWETIVWYNWDLPKWPGKKEQFLHSICSPFACMFYLVPVVRGHN